MVSRLPICILIICCFSKVAGISSTRTVALYDYCYDLVYRDSHISVSKGETIRLTIDGTAIPYSQSCYIVLKGYLDYTDLQVKFTEFSLSDYSTTLTIKSRSSSLGYPFTEGMYSYRVFPTIDYSTTTDRYVNISYVNTSPFTRTLSASVDIYIKDTTYYDYSDQVSDNIDLSIGGIIVIVGSCVAAVIGIVVIIVCCVVKNRPGRQRGTVMMAPVQNVAMPTTIYPYPAPPQQLAAQPIYVGPAPAYNTVPPNGTGVVYPTSHSQVAPNPSGEGKVQASAPSTTEP